MDSPSAAPTLSAPTPPNSEAPSHTTASVGSVPSGAPAAAAHISLSMGLTPNTCLLSTEGDFDEATTTGLSEIIDRMCLRDAILASPESETAWQQYTFHTPAVVARVSQVER
eukprot:scaffold256743_cov24-Tisochrysis_lutea.AAC.1